MEAERAAEDIRATSSASITALVFSSNGFTYVGKICVLA